MNPKNRGDRIQLLVKAVHKNFTPVLAPSDRTLLEHLLYASCLEDAPYEAADEAFHRLQESFFDWNEVRVTTVTELIEHLQNLPDPRAAALRIKKNLQSVFETRYSFDLQDMIKMNQGKAIAELEKFGGMSPFVLAYVTQHALAGHSIPVSHNIMQVLLKTEIVTEAEAAKGHVPGLDRGVPKSKGPAFGSCLHQLGLLLAESPKGKQTLAILREAGAISSEKKEPKPKESGKSKEKVKPETTTKPKDAGKASTGGKSPAAKKVSQKPADKQPPTKKAGPKPTPAPASQSKSPPSKLTGAKSPSKAEASNSATQKRKPK